MSLLSKLGLDRREVRAWAMYDWANSAFWSTVITAVFPSSSRRSPRPACRRRWRRRASPTITTVALVAVAVLSPILGAIADYAGDQKEDARRVSRAGRVRHRRHGADWRGRLEAGGRALHARQHRRHRHDRVLRFAAAARRASRTSSTACPRRRSPSDFSAAACSSR